MNNPVVYVFLNKGLHMSTGKAAAQTAHAIMGSLANIDESKQKLWMASPHRTIIVLEGRDEAHMRNIREYLFERGYDSHYVIDEGVNEIDPHVVTAQATEILEKDDEWVVKTFSSFNLYKDTVKLTLEFEK